MSQSTIEMDKGYYSLALVQLRIISLSQSTIEMDKGYYITNRITTKSVGKLSQSTIEMDKGYYADILAADETKSLAVAIHNRNG